MTTSGRRKRGVPWWTPLLGLALLAAAVVAGIAARGGGGHATATPTDPASHVLGGQRTVTHARVASPLVAAGAALLPVPDSLARLDGRTARARAVPVGEVVGPSIFWVGTGKRDRLLVHLQGGDAAHRIVTGQRLTFVGVVARNPADRGAAWGLTAAEGAAQFVAQGRHLEVYAPRIRFACRSRCS